MGFAGTAAQNAMPAIIHSATIRSGLEDAGASHWRYGAQLLRSAGSVQHFFCCSSGIVLGLNQLMRGQVVKRFSSLIDCVGALQSLWFVIIFFAYISCGGDVLHWMNNRLRRNNMTRKVTGPKAASSASKTLSSGSTGVKSKTAAASALSQTKAPAKQTSASAASAASKTLSDGRSSKASKSAAGSTLSQRAGKKK